MYAAYGFFILLQSEVYELKKIFIIVLAVITALCVFCACAPKNDISADTGEEKTVVVQVVLDDGSSQDFEIKSSKEMLGQALKDEGLIEGEEGDYGLYITKVNGVEADAASQQWWCITKGGEEVMTSIDTTPFADGDTFELTLMTGF